MPQPSAPLGDKHRHSGGFAIRSNETPSDRLGHREEARALAQALPFLGDGGRREAAAAETPDERGFVAIVKIFARTWPYLLPHIVGYWRQVPRRSERQADGAGQDGEWSSRHVPPLATALAAAGPLAGLARVGADWRGNLIVAAAALMAAFSWALLFAKGRAYVGASLALALLGTGAFAFAVFVVDGLRDNVYVGLVSCGCACIWVLQYRFEAGRLRFRIRLGSHLVYYFVLLLAATLLTMMIALFSVDLISQSILQAQPLTPFLADFLGQPELAGRAGQTAVDAGAAAANIDLQPLTADQRRGLTWVYAGFMIAAWVLQIPAMMLLPYYYIFIMQRVNQDLRMALLRRWHRLSLRYHSGHRVGDSVYRLYQDSAQVTAVIGTALQAAHLVVAYATGALFLAALDPILGAMTLSIVVLAILWGRWYSPRMRTRSLVSREVNSAFTSRVQETFAAIRLVKANGGTEAERQRLERDSVRAFHASYRARSLMAVVGIVAFSLAAAVLLAGQFLTAVWAHGERETFATILVGLVGLSFVRWNLSAYQSAQDQLGAASVSVRDLVERWTQAQDMAMGLDRVFAILDIEPDVRNSPNARAMPRSLRSLREIRFDRVHFSYEAGRPVLRDVSFAARAGTVTAIVGPTGSGKSSLMSLLFRLFDPDSGAIAIDGIDIRQLDVDSLRDHVSVALQENVLFGMSLRDNIRYVVPDASDERVLAAARVACVDEYIAGLPHGLDTVLSDRGGKLSTGQRQRLSIARAVVKDAPILILDEPTAALDVYTEHRLLDRLAAWGKKRAIFLITHRISTIAQADRILFLDAGRIVESGSHAELMRIEGGRYRDLVRAEARLLRRAEATPQTSGNTA